MNPMNGHLSDGVESAEKKSYSNPKMGRSREGEKSDFLDSDLEIGNDGKSTLKALKKKGEAFYDFAEKTVSDIHSRVLATKETVADFVTRHPFYSLLGVAMLGIAVGRAFRSSAATRRAKHIA